MLSTQRDAVLRAVPLEKWEGVVDVAALDAALAAVPAAGVLPPADLVLEALRYGGADDVRAVIIGQDPYPTPGHAQGLCFSYAAATAAPIPESLVRVRGCLEQSGALRHAQAFGDLRPWAAQGVLLLNAALTKTPGAEGTHARIWRGFVATLLEGLCRRARGGGRTLHFLLWGGAARGFADVAERHGHAVHPWSHPSPLADNQLPEPSRFRHYPGFVAVNAALKAAGAREIVWDTHAPVMVFTDGACAANGKATARGGFAAYVVGGQFGRLLIRGEVRPTLYRRAPDSASAYPGVCASDGAKSPTNNRAEYLAIIFGMLACLRGHARGLVEIVSDSDVCLNTLLEWLPSRIRKGTEGELANGDLVMIAWDLLNQLRRVTLGVALTHVKAHTEPGPPDSAPAKDRIMWRGNKMADEAAGKAITDPPAPKYAVVTAGGPPVLGALDQ